MWYLIVSIPDLCNLTYFTWFLESNNHISQFQSGFRSDRSTTDNLVRLETFIRDAFIKKEHVVAVFF